MLRRHLFLLVLQPLSLVLLPIAAGAQTPQAPSSQVTVSQPVVRRTLSPADLDRWQEQVGKAEADLKAADFEGVLRKTGKIQAEMEGSSLSEEPRLPGLVGRTFLFKALAEQATARPLDALYDLHAARAIDPSLGKLNLSLYGEPGKALFRAYVAEAREIEKNLVVPEKLAAPLKQVHPVDLQRLGRLGTDWKQPIEAQLVIGLEGLFHSPKLVTPVHPLLAITLFEGLRAARFEPPQGEAGAVMTVYFFKRALE